MDLQQKSVRGTWVQTERRAHEEWALLIGTHPKAAQLLHLLVAHMDRKSAVVVSHKVLAEMMKCSVNTVKRALVPLQAGNWIEVVRIGSGRGGVNAYLVNRRVAWADKREKQQYAAFDARIITSASEQEDDYFQERGALKQLPNIGEFPIPMGDGLPPPNQPAIEGLEPDLPVVGDAAERALLEELGQHKLL